MPYGGFNAKGFALGSFGQFGFASFGRLALASFGQIAGRGIRTRARVRLRAARGLRCRGGCRLLGLSRLASFCQMSQLASFCQMPSGVTGGLDAACIIELSDGSLAPQPGAPFVAIGRCEPRDPIALAQYFGKQLPPCGARADDVDLCFGDPARELEAFGIDIRTGDRPGQSLDLVTPGGIVTSGQAQAVAACVLRRARLAGAGPRAGARARVAPVGVTLAGAGHAASSRAGARGAPTASSASSAAWTVRRRRSAKLAR
jgi:hypothetical protein